jgi:hypothetical protein
VKTSPRRSLKVKNEKPWNNTESSPARKKEKYFISAVTAVPQHEENKALTDFL